MLKLVNMSNSYCKSGKSFRAPCHSASLKQGRNERHEPGHCEAESTEDSVRGGPHRSWQWMLITVGAPRERHRGRQASLLCPAPRSDDGEAPISALSDLKHLAGIDPDALAFGIEESVAGRDFHLFGTAVGLNL